MAGARLSQRRWSGGGEELRHPPLLVTLQVLRSFATLIMLLAELPDATARFCHHLLRHRDHNTEEVGVLKALRGEGREDS